MNRRAVHVLKWDGHLQNLNGLFQKLYHENSLVDVTLACREGSVKAHKIVLTACSPFFERVLLENPCKHPTLIMRGISLSDMQKLTAYMYKGSLEVHQDDVNSLLKIGEDLEIRGITEIKPGKKRKFETDVNRSEEVSANLIQRDTRYKGKKRVAVDHSPIRDSSPESLQTAHALLKPKVIHTKPSVGVVEEIPKKNDEPKFKKEELLTKIDTKATNDNTIIETESKPFDKKIENVEEEGKCVSEEDPNNLLVTEKTLLPCSICCKPFEDEESLDLHTKFAHSLTPHLKKYQCDLCSISFTRTSHLERHKRTHTGERPFQCNLCDRDFSRQDKLRQHLKNSHCENSVSCTTPLELDITESQNWESTSGSDEKKRRGRPRKYPPKMVDPFAEKRKRGRPKKVISDSDNSRERENYDITSLPYGDFSYLMMPPHDTEFSVVEPVVEIVSDQMELQSLSQNEPIVTIEKNTSTKKAAGVEENSLVDSVHQIGECTIRAVPPIPCTVIV